MEQEVLVEKSKKTTNLPPRFDRNDRPSFSKELKENVNNYFKQKGISTYATPGMYVKTLFCIAFEAGLYYLLVFGGFSTPINYLLWFLIGISISLITLNVGHDAIHGAYSDKKWVNTLFSMTFNFNGASSYMWSKMHNVAHHTHTNIDGHDQDIESVPFVRMNPHKPRKAYNKYQHIYGMILYGFATIAWVFIKDYKKFFSNDVGNHSGEKHPAKEYFLLFFYKAIYYTLFIVLPIMFIEQPLVHTILGFVLMHLVAGYWLAIIFMLAHTVDDATFPKPNEENYIENSWTIHQLYTTANFSVQNPVAGFLSGGLNLQVEHHLFPNICTAHYRKISGIVKETAKAHNLPYIEYPTFWSALKSHLRFLKRLGRTDGV